LGLALLTQVEGDSDLAVVVIGSVVVALGVAPPVTLATDLIVGCAPPERAGVASGISETGAELGGALGIAVLGSIGVAVYRNELGDAALAGVPPAQAASASDTLGGALEAADTLPEQPAAALLDTAQEAFTQGLQIAALTGAAVAVATAVMAAVFLRRTRTGPPPEPRASEQDAAVEAAAP
jgi:MFS transporter, DHA2 family, multidrug resistance protein